jgi:hypothetical protein
LGVRETGSAIQLDVKLPLQNSTFVPKMSIRKAIARALGFSLVAAFVWVGGAALITTVRRDTLNLPLDPDVSSDFVLAAIGVSHSTQVVNEMLRPWEENKVLLVVTPTVSMRVEQVYFELLVLGYPRRLPAIMCNSHPRDASTLFHPELATRNMDGLIFFDIVPGRSITVARRVAPNLYTAPPEEVPTWNSFCP